MRYSQPRIFAGASVLATLVFLGGCISRSAELVGNWDAGDEWIRIETDGNWSSYKKSSPSFISRAGSSSVHGSIVSLQPSSTTAPPPPEMVFTMSPDGRGLKSADPANPDMRKQ